MKLATSMFCALMTIVAFGQAKTTLLDSEIAAVAVVANQIDIDYAKIALKKSKNREIIDFATRMIEDHEAVIAQATALVQKLGVTPQESSVSQSLIDGAKTKKTELKRARKRDFDLQYITNEVSYHKAVISAINQLLIPSARNPELKELLEAVVPALEIHLGHAEMVHKNLNDL